MKLPVLRPLQQRAVSINVLNVGQEGAVGVQYRQATLEIFHHHIRLALLAEHRGIPRHPLPVKADGENIKTGLLRKGFKDRRNWRQYWQVDCMNSN